jgi:hypothetical protein
MPTLDDKIKKVMFSLTVLYRGNHDFWVSKGFNRYRKSNPEGLFNYWKNKALAGDPELLNKIDELWNAHLNLAISKKNNEPQPKPEPPSLFQMAKNVTSAASRFIKTGMKVVTEEQLQQRLEICRSCDKFDSAALNGTGRCLLCGCSTALKLKMASEKCPVDKWKAIV